MTVVDVRAFALSAPSCTLIRDDKGDDGLTFVLFCRCCCCCVCVVFKFACEHQGTVLSVSCIITVDSREKRRWGWMFLLQASPETARPIRGCFQSMGSYCGWRRV